MNKKPCLNTSKIRKPAKAVVGSIDNEGINGKVKEGDCREDGLILYICLHKIKGRYIPELTFSGRKSEEQSQTEVMRP